MKILILEGVATSGKSTVITGLKERLGGGDNLRIRFAGEAETHTPITRQAKELHIAFFLKLIDRLVKESPDVIIFDRLYVTQAIRAGANIRDYAPVERILAQYDTFLMGLIVDESALATRIAKSTEHRDSQWNEYIKTVGQTTDEIAEHYINRQNTLLELLHESTLPHSIYNTTTHNYEPIIDDIVTFVRG